MRSAQLIARLAAAFGDTCVRACSSKAPQFFSPKSPPSCSPPSLPITPSALASPPASHLLIFAIAFFAHEFWRRIVSAIRLRLDPVALARRSGRASQSTSPSPRASPPSLNCRNSWNRDRPQHRHDRPRVRRPSRPRRHPLRCVARPRPPEKMLASPSPPSSFPPSSGSLPRHRRLYGPVACSSHRTNRGRKTPTSKSPTSTITESPSPAANPMSSAPKPATAASPLPHPPHHPQHRHHQRPHERVRQK